AELSGGCQNSRWRARIARATVPSPIVVSLLSNAARAFRKASRSTGCIGAQACTTAVYCASVSASGRVINQPLGNGAPTLASMVGGDEGTGAIDLFHTFDAV